MVLERRKQHIHSTHPVETSGGEAYAVKVCLEHNLLKRELWVGIAVGLESFIKLQSSVSQEPIELSNTVAQAL